MNVSQTTSSIELRLSDCLKKVYWSVGTVRPLESFQISTLSPKSLWQSIAVCWAPCPDKNVQGDEERGEWEGANGTAKLGVQWHWLGWIVQLWQAVILEGEWAIIVPFPSEDHLQREESWKSCNNQSAHWQLAVQFYGASKTLKAPVKKYATTSDFIIFRG